jgi:hypothetical protein
MKMDGNITACYSVVPRVEKLCRRKRNIGRRPFPRMVLLVARAEKRRPELAKRLRARRKLIADSVATAARNNGRHIILEPAWIGSIILAMEDGFRLHRLIDPETTPSDSFFQRHQRSAARDRCGVEIGFSRRPAPCAVCPANAQALRGDACRIAIACDAMAGL